MTKREITKEVKITWLSRMFYGVSHAMEYNLNPYEELSVFLESRLSSWKWKGDRREVKDQLSHKYHLLLELYDIKLSKNVILKALENEQQSAIALVEHWADQAEFPANW